MSDRYIDPNSGAAQQPGGYATGSAVRATSEESKAHEAEPATDASYDAEVEHSAGPGGRQEANPEGVNAGEGGASAESPEEGEEAGAEEDYSELLSGSVDDVEQYLQEYPEEKDAVIAAEKKREKPRKGVLGL